MTISPKVSDYGRVSCHNTFFINSDMLLLSSALVMISLGADSGSVLRVHPQNKRDRARETATICSIPNLPHIH
jgi:hypothetical protein